MFSLLTEKFITCGFSVTVTCGFVLQCYSLGVVSHPSQGNMRSYLSLCSPPPSPAVIPPLKPLCVVCEERTFKKLRYCRISYSINHFLGSVLRIESSQYNQIVRDRRMLFILDVFTVWSVLRMQCGEFLAYIFILQCFSLNILMLNTVCCSF